MHLDHFKRINDTFGHPVGDEVLQSFSIAVGANIRSIDRLGRYGGEEFLLILPYVSAEEATAALNRLRRIVAALNWTAISGGLAVTMSAGVVQICDDETPGESLRVLTRRFIARRTPDGIAWWVPDPALTLPDRAMKGTSAEGV